MNTIASVAARAIAFPCARRSDLMRIGLRMKPFPQRSVPIPPALRTPSISDKN